MIKASHIGIIAVAFLLFFPSSRAQLGCTDSPEAPTVILMLLGATGIYGSSITSKALRLRSLRQRAE
jgi:XrtJ-associated TM-motif-TM protein